MMDLVRFELKFQPHISPVFEGILERDVAYKLAAMDKKAYATIMQAIHEAFRHLPLDADALLAVELAQSKRPTLDLVRIIVE